MPPQCNVVGALFGVWHICNKHRKQCLGLPLALRCERKVRAAQGAPLLKVEAIGDSRIRQKKTTASHRQAGKGEKVV